MGKKKRSSVPDKKSKTFYRPKKEKDSNSATSGLYDKLLLLFTFLPPLLAVIIAVRQKYDVSLSNFGNETIETIDPVRTRLEYNENGFVPDRLLAEVNLMDKSLESQFRVDDPLKLSPYIQYLPGPPMQERKQRAMGARFRNFYPFDLTKWWDDGSAEGVYSGVIPAHGFSATNTYTTHKFIFRRKDNNEFIQKITMMDNRHLYFIGPDPNDKKVFESKEYMDAVKEIEFMKEYHKKNGVPWLSHYPRGPPELFLYPADFVGQVHKVKSYIGYHKSKNEQSLEPIDFEIKVLSTSPRVLLIENLLNDYEISHIIRMGEKVVSRSRVGSASDGFQSNTRTSENGWLKRTQSIVLNTIYYRFADVLGMTDEQLRDDGMGSAENLQFVRYLSSQRYDAHHDFGYTGRKEQRFSTLLIYLEVPEKGGGTSFPKAFDGQGISVKPKPGDAVLFYSMLPDGNGDDMSLHAGMPVEDGRKYVCNLWSWDPKIR